MCIHLGCTNLWEVGTTSNPHGPYRVGYTCATEILHSQMLRCKPVQICKKYLGSDHCLQLGNVKAESSVIANQQVAVKIISLSGVLTACHTRRIWFVGK